MVDHSRDEHDLARFGYQQELKRSLGVFSSFAVAFSYISPSTGIFTLFALGLTTLGGVFIWTWPVVALGQFIIALNFAVVATLPLALIPALNGLGWHSLGAGDSNTVLHTQLVIALITLVVITVLNIYGVRLVAIINNTGVVFEIL